MRSMIVCRIMCSLLMAYILRNVSLEVLLTANSGHHIQSLVLPTIHSLSSQERPQSMTEWLGIN